MRNYLWLSVPIFILLIFSCQAPGGPEDFPPPEELSEEEAAETGQVKSIGRGKFVSKQESIPIEVDTENLEEEAAELLINLTDTSGTIVASQKHFFEESPEKVNLPDLVLPEIPEGQYVLHYIFYNKEGEAFHEEKVSFFYITQTYEINGIWSFPNAIQPRSTAMLKADLNMPKESNPYLRWKVGDAVVSEGYNSEGARSFSWIAPEVEGIYSVSLELFPVKPEEETAFSSEIQMDTEIYVSSEPEPDKRELQPEGRYYSLYHFRGNTFDSGYRQDAGKAAVTGTPELKLKGETYGYYLDGASGFTVPELLLPLEGTKLLPFSLVMKAIFEPLAPNRLLFSSAAEDGAFTFSLETNESGRLQVRITNNGKTVVSVVPVETEKNYYERG